MEKNQNQIFQQREKLKLKHKSLLQEEQRAEHKILTDIEFANKNLKGINHEISGLNKKTTEIQSSITQLRAQRSQLKNELSQLQKEQNKIQRQIQKIGDSIKAGESQTKILKQRFEQLKTQARQEDKNGVKQLAKRQKQEEYIRQLNLRQQQLTSNRINLGSLQLKLSQIKKKAKQLVTSTESSVTKQEQDVKQIKQVNGLISRLSSSSEQLKKEIVLKEAQLKRIQTHNKMSAEKRIELISSLPQISTDQTFFISNQGLQYILNHFDPQNPQRNLNYVTDYKVELPIRVKKSGPASKRPCTLIDVWNEALIKFGDRPALTFQASPNNWKSYTFQEYYNNAIRFGKACISVGLSEYSIVMIMGFNSPQWAFSFYGAMFARYLPVGMYTTNSSETCEYIANHSEGQLVVVQNEIQLRKYYEIIDKCPKIKYLVIYNQNVPSNIPQRIKGRVFTWKQFLAMGDKFNPTKKQDDIKYRQSIQKPGNCATFIYTSGTTGMPKAVMTSHDNYIFQIDGVISHYRMDRPSLLGKGRILSYLPLSHASAQLVDLLVPIRCGYNVYFPDPTVLTTNLVKFLTIVRPTNFLGVPRVWQKIQEKLGESLALATGFKKKLIQWALSIGLQGTFAEAHNRQTPRGWGIAKKLLFNKIQQSLGFDQCEMFLFGAAPMKQTSRKFYLSINFLLLNNYGMSECSGAHTFTNMKNWPQFNRDFLKEAGSIIVGGQLGLEDQDKEGKGEICMRGRHVFMGYYKNEQETKKTINKNGFLRSGDEGRLDENNNLYITGRIKELIVTAGGQNIPPLLIQQEITAALPIVSQAVVIGDHRKYLSVLLCLKLKNGQELTDEVQELIKKHGSQAKTIKQAIKCSKIKEIVSKGITQANKKALSNAQKVQKYTILPLQFTVESGILTPTMKVKRKVVSQTFNAEIQSMYIDSKL